MMRNKLNLLFLGLAALGCTLTVASRAGAAGQSSPQGITVSPAFQQVIIPAAAEQQPVNFAITNDRAVSQTINLSAADFNTLDETGGLFFVGANPTQLEKKYGLAKWIKLPQNSVTILPKQTINITAQLLSLPDLAPGGHYGAVMLAIDNGAGTTASNNINLHPIASSLLFVTKLGGDTHKLGLSAVTFSHNFIKLPSGVVLRFHNDGNTHLIPRGTVSVSGADGKLVSKGIINVDSGIILPQTFRRYDVPLQQVTSSKSAGSYKLRVDFRFDGIDQFRTYQASFFYFSPALIVILLIIMLIIAAGGVWLYKKLMPKNKRNIKIEFK